MARRPTDTVQLKLRFPERLRRRIEQAAERDKQSMNAEIVKRLEESFHKEDELERSRELIQETIDATIYTLAQDLREPETKQNRTEGAAVLSIMGRLREQLREEARPQLPAKKEQQTNKPTGTGDK